MFAVLCSDGVVKPVDIVGSVREEQWVPLAVTKPRNDPQGIPTLLLFEDHLKAKKFAERNFPKDWMISVVELADTDHNWIKERGWNIEVLAYPRLMNSHPDYELTYEILEFNSKPDVIIRG